MNQKKESTLIRHKKRRIEDSVVRKKQYSSIAVVNAAAVIGFVCSIMDYAPAALGAFAFLIVCTINRTAIRFGLLEAIVGVFSACMLFAILINVWGQYFINFKIPGWLVVGIVFPLLTLSNYDTNEKDLKSYRLALLTGLLTFFVIVVTNEIAGQHVISFLGYGYDNAAHVASMRKVVLDRAFFADNEGPNKLVTFLGSTPQGPAAGASLLADIAGESGQSLAGVLRIFLVATALVPIGTIVFVFIALKNTTSSAKHLVFFSFLFTAVCLIGYPSHMWFSGYFSSNFATLILLMATAIFVLGKQTLVQLFLVLSLTVVQSYVYLLYVPPLLLLTLFLLHDYRKINTNWKEDLRKSFRRPTLVFMLLLDVILVTIAVRGIFSQYGASQFLEAGGIEPLPIATIFFVFGSTVFLFTVSENQTKVVRQISISTLILVTVACVGSGYSVWRTGSIMYYPTKLVTSIFLTVFFLLLLRLSQQPRRQSEVRLLASQLIIVTIIVTYVGLNPTIFRSAFMGSGKNVLTALKDRRAEVVDGSIVMELTRISSNQNRPILQLFPERESELNTRWINVLSGQWTDESWISWMKIRSLLSEDKRAEAEAEIEASKVLVVIRDQNLSAEWSKPSNQIDHCIVDQLDETKCLLR